MAHNSIATENSLLLAVSHIFLATVAVSMLLVVVNIVYAAC